MIDIEAEARAIVDGKGEAWDRAVEKLTQAWDSGDAATITAWQGVFGRYQEIASRARQNDGFFDLHIFMDAGNLAGGLDPRPETEEERAAREAGEAEFRAELAAGLHNDPPSGRDPNLDDDIPY